VLRLGDRALRLLALAGLQQPYQEEHEAFLLDCS
jgi:hypothetical protein